MDHGLLVPVRPRGVQTVAERLAASLGPISEAIDRLHDAGLRASMSSLADDERLRAQLGRDSIRKMVRLLDENGFITADGNTKNRDLTVDEKGRFAIRANPRESRNAV